MTELLLKMVKAHLKAIVVWLSISLFCSLLDTFHFCQFYFLKKESVLAKDTLKTIHFKDDLFLEEICFLSELMAALKTNWPVQSRCIDVDLSVNFWDLDLKFWEMHILNNFSGFWCSWDGECLLAGGNYDTWSLIILLINSPAHFSCYSFLAPPPYLSIYLSGESFIVAKFDIFQKGKWS